MTKEKTRPKPREAEQLSMIPILRLRTARGCYRRWALAGNGGNDHVCTCHYKQIALDAIEMLNLDLGDILWETVAHEPCCAIHESKCCDCAPRITFTTHGGDVVVHEWGQIQPMTVN